MNSACIGIYCRGSIQGGSIGSLISYSSKGAILRVSTGSAMVTRLNQDSSAGSVSLSNFDSSGMTIMSREASNSYSVYRNGFIFSNGTTASTDIPNIKSYIGAVNLNGTASGFAQNQTSAAFFSKKFDSFTGRISN